MIPRLKRSNLGIRQSLIATFHFRRSFGHMKGAAVLVVYLASSGGRIEIPHAVECVDTGDTDFVSFVDVRGMCLVRFSRADVSMYAPPHQAPELEPMQAGREELPPARKVLPQGQTLSKMHSVGNQRD